jgi:hypothetical protein
VSPGLLDGETEGFPAADLGVYIRACALNVVKVAAYKRQ